MLKSKFDWKSDAVTFVSDRCFCHRSCDFCKKSKHVGKAGQQLGELLSQLVRRKKRRDYFSFFYLEIKETKVQGCVLDFVELLAFAPLPHPNLQTALASFFTKSRCLSSNSVFGYATLSGISTKTIRCRKTQVYRLDMVFRDSELDSLKRMKKRDSSLLCRLIYRTQNGSYREFEKTPLNVYFYRISKTTL